MEKTALIKLTNQLYRLTLFFPKKEPLRYKTRELAINLLAEPKTKDLEVLDSFLEVALVQNWASPADILAIKEEYAILGKELLGKREVKESQQSLTVLGQPSLKKLIPNGHNSDRKEKIMAFLKENGKAQVWQVKQLMPEVAKRTLRRDFEHMLEQGLIERLGERNDTFYTIKNLES